MLSPFRVGGSLTVLSWTQGTPTGELAAIRGQAATIRRLCGRRLYLTLVGYYRWKTCAVRRLLPRAGTLICASRWEAEQWRGLTEPGRSIEVLPYPYDVDRFRPVQRQPDAPGAVTFLHLGRIVPRKRLDLLLEAFQRVRRELPAAKLLLIGRFAYASGFRRLLSDPVLSQNVEYRAGIPRGEVPDLLGRVDLVIQTSENENLGSAIAEAQCCGLPVILGPTNGTKDYVAPSSFVFTAYTPEAVAAAMLQAARAIQGGRAELSADARAAASRHFSLPAVVDRLEGILARASRRTPSRKGCP
jgi:glycosyltransferase involved in cell wall biosynthesis